MLVVVGYGLTLPSQIHVEREIVINASPEAVFAPIGDLKRHAEWNTWLQKDPNNKIEICIKQIIIQQRTNASLSCCVSLIDKFLTFLYTFSYF